LTYICIWPEITVGELADLEVDQHVAAQQTVVEHQIDEEVLLVKGEAFLPGLEQEAFAQFEQEVFDLVDDGRFQVGFGIPGLLISPRNSST
jgi:hypothetical protein